MAGRVQIESENAYLSGWPSSSESWGGYTGPSSSGTWRAKLPCQSPRLMYIRGGRVQDRGIPIYGRCNNCPACQQTKLNDIEGRIGAHSLVCTHVDMVTLTYDAERSAEAGLGSMVRYAKHHSDFVKRLRAQEHYALLKRNAAELEAASASGRSPELVDTSRSYIDAYSVHEFGSGGTKRSHWHSLIFYLSHFPIPDAALATGDLRACRPFQRRVWDFKSTRGFSEKLPECANDPSVLSYKTTSLQEWKLWPHGAVQVQSATHYRAGIKPGKRGAVREVIDPSGEMEKPVADLAKSLRYLNKYLRKDVETKDKDGVKLRGAASLPDGYKPVLHEGTRRTQSLSLGRHFAAARARYQASTGIPVRDLNYRLAGFELRRSLKSEHKYRESLSARTVSPLVADRLVNRQKTFTFCGSLARIFVTEYEAARTANGRAFRVDELGEEVIRAKQSALTFAMRRKLQGPEYAALRYFQPTAEKELFPLSVDQTPVPVYRFCGSGEPADGKFWREGRRPLEKLTALERLRAREAEICEIERAYARAREIVGGSRGMSMVKCEVSRRGLEDILTEAIRDRRGTGAQENYLSPADNRRFVEVRKELEQACSNGDTSAADKLALLEKWRWRPFKAPFELPRHNFGTYDVMSSLIQHWLNYSDDFEWRHLREEAIERFCVQLAGKVDSWRIIQNPSGEKFLQRRSFSKQKAVFRCPNTARLIRHAGFPVWLSRKLRSPEDERSAFANELVVTASHRDGVFLGDEPLKSVTC